MRIIIDRIIENIAVVEIQETGEMVDVPMKILQGAKEGDIIDIIINHKDTEKEKENKKKLLKNLFR